MTTMDVGESQQLKFAMQAALQAMQGHNGHHPAEWNLHPGNESIDRVSSRLRTAIQDRVAPAVCERLAGAARERIREIVRDRLGVELRSGMLAGQASGGFDFARIEHRVALAHNEPVDYRGPRKRRSGNGKRI